MFSAKQEYVTCRGCKQRGKWRECGQNRRVLFAQREEYWPLDFRAWITAQNVRVYSARKRGPRLAIDLHRLGMSKAKRKRRD